MSLNYIPSRSIPNGTTFVAIHGDGSGASLFMITDDGELCSAENGPENISAPDVWLVDTGYMYWIELPDTFKLWFETVEEERP